MIVNSDNNKSENKQCKKRKDGPPIRDDKISHTADQIRSKQPEDNRSSERFLREFTSAASDCCKAGDRCDIEH